MNTESKSRKILKYEVDSTSEQIYPDSDVIDTSNIKNDNPLITDKGFVVVGSADAGKSTLIGTLTSGILDDGRGSARLKIARHQHEKDSGKTSDITSRILKFPNGKTATLIDLCGQDKYFTTTATGIAGMWPDYAIVVISPSRGIVPMTKQHFKMLMSFNIPILIVITRVDMAVEESCKITDKGIKDLCKDYKRTTEFMNSYADYHSYIRGTKLIPTIKNEYAINLTSIDDFTDSIISELKVKFFDSKFKPIQLSVEKRKETISEKEHEITDLIEKIDLIKKEIKEIEDTIKPKILEIRDLEESNRIILSEIKEIELALKTKLSDIQIIKDLADSEIKDSKIKDLETKEIESAESENTSLINKEMTEFEKRKEILIQKEIEQNEQITIIKKDISEPKKTRNNLIKSETELSAKLSLIKKIIKELDDSIKKDISDIDDSIKSDISDIKEALNFDTSKMTCIGEINQGLKMAGGRQTYIPIVYCSNVDGYYLDVIKQAMMTIEPRDLWSTDENANSIVKFFRTKLGIPRLGLDNTHIGSTFYIDRPYIKRGVGLIVSGINRGDSLNVNDEIYLGPIAKTFVKVKLRSMHNDNTENVDQLANHHRGCIAIKGIKDDLKKNQITRGMVMISKPEMLKNVCYNFEAAVTIFGGHSATLRTGYSPVVHAGTIRQSAKLILPDEKLTEEDLEAISLLTKKERKEKTQKKIKSGDVERVRFKFRVRPEYLDPGTVFVFRSGEIHGVGCVISVVPLDTDTDAQPEPLKKKFRRIRPSDQVKDTDGKMHERGKKIVIS
jgi:GTPase